jgi:hypothetical protein
MTPQTHTKTRTKFFRVAVEGDTTDGRAIARADIIQMAQSFNPQTYGARVWLEHIRGFTADSPFRAYGDVLAVKAEEITDGALKGKLALYAQIEPTADLVALNTARQKLYTSIEMQPDFPATGGTYLVGLAVTDSPASLGTEMLAFSASAPINPLAARKLAPENLFSVALETLIELQPDEPERPSLLGRVTELLGFAQQKNRTDLSDIHQAVETITQAVVQETVTREQTAQQFSRQLATLTDQLNQQQQAFTDLQSQLARQPASPSRLPATGGDHVLTTDC